jgi:RND family efflux transporter MFP subunit
VRSATDGLQSYVGDVRATQRADLSFGVAGLVSEVAVQVGDVVRQGQILASLDNKPQQEQLAAASADLQRAQAAAAEAHQRVERMRPAQQADAASSTEWGAVQLELASAQAAVKAAQAQREQAVWALDKTRLRSPIDGVVALRNLERGQAAGPGAPVMAVDGSGRELVIHVPGNLSLKPGQKVQLQGLGSTLPSRVLHSAERLDAGGVRQVWLAVPSDAQVGSTWSVTVSSADQGKASAVLQIPLRAVMPDPSGNTGTALRLAKDGQTLEKLTLKLGQIQGDWLEVKEADSLRPGDRVVVAGALAMRAGMKIQPVMAKP